MSHETSEFVSLIVTVAKPSSVIAVKPLITTCLKSSVKVALTIVPALDVAVKLIGAFKPLVCTVNGTVTDLYFLT